MGHGGHKVIEKSDKFRIDDFLIDFYPTNMCARQTTTLHRTIKYHYH